MVGVDLAYLREHADEITSLVRARQLKAKPLAGGDFGMSIQVTLDDGSHLFSKTRPGAPPDFFAAEVAGLRWLSEAGGPPVPEVIAATTETLVMQWIVPGKPDQRAAEKFGRALAAMHRSGADQFGAPWPGYIGTLPMPNEPADSWAEFYVERRCLPFLRQAADSGALDPGQATTVERALDRIPDVAGPPEPPSRIHGDLWAGNLLYGADGQAWLIDPAAHGGHRETDLAMMALFGAPLLDRTLGAYREAYPLADGWKERTPLHQLHPLLVHTVLFGAGYAAQTVAAARAVRRL